MATVSKPLCGCKHPFEDHEEIRNSQNQSQFVCMHVDLRPSLGVPVSVCGCNSYKAAMTLEDKFKNCVVQAVLNYDAEMEPKDAQDIADRAWENFSL